MMEEAQSAEWKPLANLYYRKFKMYSMSWEADLTKNDVIGAPFGGPIGKSSLTVHISWMIPDFCCLSQR
jgi:hypothetical protein